MAERPWRLWLLALGALLGACDDATLTRDEARGVLDEMSLSIQVNEFVWDIASLAAELSEGTTGETLVNEVVQAIDDRPPCLAVASEDDGSGASLRFNADTVGGGCVWRGGAWLGEVVLSPPSGSQGARLTFNTLAVDDFLLAGAGEVASPAPSQERTLTMELEWSLGANQRTAEHTESVTPLASGAGRLYAGDRSWQAATGQWSLVMDSLRVLDGEPIPEEGVVNVITPTNKSVNLSFDRSGEREIRVTIAGPGASFVFTVQLP